jgi:hypothetical protein
MSRPTPFFFVPFVVIHSPLSEDFEGGVARDAILLSQFRFHSGINLGQNDRLRALLQLLGCFLVLGGKLFAVTTPTKSCLYKYTENKFPPIKAANSIRIYSAHNPSTLQSKDALKIHLQETVLPWLKMTNDHDQLY